MNCISTLPNTDPALGCSLGKIFYTHTLNHNISTKPGWGGIFQVTGAPRYEFLSALVLKGIQCRTEADEILRVGSAQIKDSLQTVLFFTLVSRVLHVYATDWDIALAREENPKFKSIAHN